VGRLALVSMQLIASIAVAAALFAVMLGPTLLLLLWGF